MEQKIITLRVDIQDYNLLKETQGNLKITSLNTVIKDLIFNDYSVYKLHEKSVINQKNRITI